MSQEDLFEEPEAPQSKRLQRLSDISGPQDLKQRINKNIDFGGHWNLLKTSKGVRYLEDEEGNLLAIIATTLNPNAQTPMISGTAISMSDGGTPAQYFSLRSSFAGDATRGRRTNAQVQLTHAQDNNGTITWFANIAIAIFRGVSAANASQAVTLDTGNLSQSLSVNMLASGATATVLIEVSVDNVNFITLDSVAAALEISKVYGASTAGTTRALSPLSFRFVRITAGAAGVGNTTTLTVAVK